MDREPLKFKSVHLGLGLDLLGSVTSLNVRNGNTLIEHEMGIMAHSKKTGRDVLVPWANIKGAEVLKEASQPTGIKTKIK